MTDLLGEHREVACRAENGSGDGDEEWSAMLASDETDE